MFKDLFSNSVGDLAPHGTCLLWRTDILTLHVVSDAAIAMAYYSIPLALIYFVSKRKDLRFRGLFLLFGIFILACGTTHLMELWTIWVPDYVLSGWIKAFTAVVSVGAAISLWPIIPAALRLPSPDLLAEANGRLLREVDERKQTEERVRQLNDQLERLVDQRTAELMETNRRLEGEVAERRRAEDSLRESEYRYRTLFEQMPDAVVLVDPANGAIIDANERAHDNLGYSREAFAKQNIVNIDRLETPEDVAAHLEKICRLGEDSFETEHLAQDGSVRHVRVSARVVQLREQRFIQSIFTDISAYKKLELVLRAQKEELRQSRQRLQHILDISPAAVYILKPESESGLFRTVFCTESILAIAGYPPSDWYEQPSFWDERLHPADRDRAMTGQNSLLSQGELTHEYRFRHRDGTYRWIHDQLVVARDSDGNVNEIIGTWIDVTEAKKSQQALAQAKDAAEAANRAKTQFLAHISHELRTPMNCILGFTQILQRDPALAPRHQDHLGSIQRAGLHLQTLISDLLDLARIESGKLEVHEAHFDLAECLDNLASMFELRARQKGIEFRFSHDDVWPRQVLGDDKHLRQIVINLLSNAVKFTPAGRVEWGVAYAGGRVRMRFEDTGPGIAPEDLERIFAPFEQLEYRPSPEGTGLGLAITRRLVHAMGGRIEVSSTVGSGTLFTVELPLPPGEESRNPEPSVPAAAEFEGQAERILVADDNQDNLMVMEAALESMGFVVACARDGAECLAKCGEFAPHLILLDLVMPGMDGMETLARLRAQPNGRAPRVIAVTANAFEETKRACLAAGFDDFITKPVDLDDLYARIDVNLQALRAQAPIQSAAPSG